MSTALRPRFDLGFLFKSVTHNTQWPLASVCGGGVGYCPPVLRVFRLPSTIISIFSYKPQPDGKHIRQDLDQTLEHQPNDIRVDFECHL